MGNYRRQHYHASCPAWRDDFSLIGPYIGVEFEVDSSSYNEVLRLLPDFPAGERPITEIDGSLGSNGVEIIFPPVPYVELKRATSVFHQSIAAIKDVVEHNYLTGMHMNVNTVGWKAQASNVFSIIVNHMDPQHLCNLGGRLPGEYCWQSQFLSPDRYEPGTARHSVADNKHNRIELRFPASTCDKKTIDTLVDFIDKLRVYSNQSPDAKLRDLSKVRANPVPKARWDWDYSPTLHRYEALVEDFYAYLGKTVKGRKVLEAIHTKREPLPERDYIDDDDRYEYEEDDDY